MWLSHSFQQNSDITSESFSTRPSRQPLLITQTWLSRQNPLAIQDLAHFPALPPPFFFTDKHLAKGWKAHGSRLQPEAPKCPAIRFPVQARGHRWWPLGGCPQVVASVAASDLI